MSDFDDVFALLHKVELFDKGIDPLGSQESVRAWVERFSKAPVISQALRLGFDAHKAVGQMRNYQEDVPYFVHPIAVAIYVARLLNGVAVSEFEKNKMIAAGLLHDVLEDTKASKHDIRAMVGGDVLDLVWQLTDQYTKENYPDLNRAARKELELQRMSKMDPQAVLVKLCDSWHNLQDISRHDKDFIVLYKREKSALLSVWLNRVEQEAYPGPLGEAIYAELLRQQHQLSHFGQPTAI